MINSRVIGGLAFSSIAETLTQLGVGGGEVFWQAVRGNINRIEDAKTWYDIATQPITPVVETGAVMDAAIAHLPEGEMTAETWGIWTKAIINATGEKGRAVFMPLRLALTGQSSGPELRGVLPVMGRDRILARLKGEAA